MKKLILVSIVISLTAFTAFSQTKQESIKQLFSLMKTETMLEKFVLPLHGFSNNITSKSSNSSFMDSLKPMINKIMNEDMVELYDKYYSEDEINDMIRFYKSKTGQKMITTSPELQKEIMGVIQTKYMGEFMKSHVLKLGNITIRTKPKHLPDSASIAEMKKEYLDMDTTNLQSATPEQQQILMKAINRMDRYGKYENKVFSSTVKNANEVNMSERLFDLLKNMMKHGNAVIKDLNVVPDKNDPTIMRVITDEKQEPKINLIEQKKTEYDTNLYEYGGVSECEDNLKNLIRNFPIYIENGDEIDFLSYEFVGTIKNKKDAQKYVEKNFDDFPLLGWLSEMTGNGDDYSSYIRLFGITNDAFTMKINIMVESIIKYDVNIGDKVYAIDYVFELQKRRHYVIINPKTKKVAFDGTIFGVNMTQSHVEYINEKRSRE